MSRDGAWTHLAVTWTAANDGLTTIYQDGETSLRQDLLGTAEQPMNVVVHGLKVTPVSFLFRCRSEDGRGSHWQDKADAA